MREWDRLWNDYGNIKHPKWLELVKAEGDKLQDRHEQTVHQMLRDSHHYQKNITKCVKKLEAIRVIAFDPENVDDPYVSEARALRKIREMLGE